MMFTFHIKTIPFPIGLISECNTPRSVYLVFHFDKATCDYFSKSWHPFPWRVIVFPLIVFLLTTDNPIDKILVHPVD